jgi:hypothetical protein
MSHPIISAAEARQIRRNDLKRQALERHAAELQSASPGKKTELLAQIERELDEELGKEKRERPWSFLIS